MRNYIRVLRYLAFTLSVTIVTWICISGVADSHAIALGTMIYNVVLWGSLLLPDPDAREGAIQHLFIHVGCGLIGLCLGASLGRPGGFSFFLAFFSIFHFLEFGLTSVSHPARFQSLLLNHGVEYASAFSASTLEHFFSPVQFPEWVQSSGLIIAILGLIVRGTALLTAGPAFTHIISTSRKASHQLVTSGIYRYIRHPGYCGWLLWVVGSQLLAGNPICSVAFAAVTWKFFSERIEYEESLLESMFGSEYDHYRFRTTWSGVPFIP